MLRHPCQRLTTNAGSYAVLTNPVGFFSRQRLPALLVGVAIGCAANFATASRFVYPHRAPIGDAPEVRE